jgi:hypothetical protein
VSALLGPLMITGVGIGLIYGLVPNTGTFGVAHRDAGVASASIQAAQQLGGSIGTALLNTIAAGATAGYLASHLHGRSAQVTRLAAIHGYTMVFWWCTGIFAAGAIVCGALLRRGPLTRAQDAPDREPSRQTAGARS